MAIIHRYLDELNQLEQNHTFCNQPVNPQSNILIIGTFNPSNNSCEKENNATWFYGRKQSKFWRYLPIALTGQSLHTSDGHNGSPITWKRFCIANRIVIIDLIKSIEINEILPDFGDKEVECKINNDLTNTIYFNIAKAFKNIRFQKVIYSLAWTDPNIKRMRQIKNILNQQLLDAECIQNRAQIKYCKTPSRNDAFNSWNDAINF